MRAFTKSSSGIEDSRSARLRRPEKARNGEAGAQIDKIAAQHAQRSSGAS
jgi:hypothetical protein